MCVFLCLSALHDMDYLRAYEKSNHTPLRNFYNTVNFLLVGSNVAFLGIWYLNINIDHTYMHSVPPGTLLSDRFGLDWWSYALLTLRILIPFCNLWLLTQVTETLGPEIKHIFTVTIIWGLDIVIGLKLVFDIRTLNTEDAPFHFGNDPLYCCAFFSNPTNRCLNFPNQCIPPVTPDELSISTDFWIVFGITWGFVFLEFLNVIAVARLWASKRYQTQGRAIVRRREQQVSSKIPETDIATPSEYSSSSVIRPGGRTKISKRV